MTTPNTENDMVTTEDGDTIPRSEAVCICGDWYSLHDCVQLHDGDWVLADDAVEIDGDYYHSDDCTLCESCSEWRLSEDTRPHPRRSRGSICEPCYSEYYFECPECGSDTDVDDGECNDAGDYVCNDCRGSGGLSSYGDRSADRLRPESRDKQLYGIELEVEAAIDLTSGIEFIRRHLAADYAVLKEDGSLSDEGIEIVTRPDSVEVHKKKWASFLDGEPARRLTSWTNGRCGMHVHVTKASLSQLQLGKMLVFVNEPANQHLVSTVAGRSSERWARVEKKKISDVRYPDERYVALNITLKTAEFRIFKGTLNKRGFLKNLEFCQALIEFCGPAKRSMAEAASAAAFLEWLPRKSYPNLHDFLAEKGLVRRRPTNGK